MAGLNIPLQAFHLPKNCAKLAIIGLKDHGMKQILVGIDFSKASMHALDYALMLATEVHAAVKMVWVDDQARDEFLLSSGTAEKRKEVHRAFDELLTQKQEMKGLAGLSYKIRRGKVYAEMAGEARMSKVDLVVTGSHGVSGFEEFWIGSNANRIVSHSPCPVITIRPDYPIPNKLTVFVLPLDETLNTLEKVHFTARMAKYFKARVEVLGLYSTRLKSLQKKVDNAAMLACRTMEKLGVEHNYTGIYSENITFDTLQYVEQLNADLLSIMTEQESSSSKILLGQSAQLIVNNCKVPVLNIQPTEVTGRL